MGISTTGTGPFATSLSSPGAALPSSARCPPKAPDLEVEPEYPSVGLTTKEIVDDTRAGEIEPRISGR